MNCIYILLRSNKTHGFFSFFVWNENSLSCSAVKISLWSSSRDHSDLELNETVELIAILINRLLPYYSPYIYILLQYKSFIFIINI